MDTAETIAKGLNLIEVFRVIYVGNEVPPEKQIGTIKVDDCLNTQYLYNVEEVDMSRSPIQHADDIVLAGPNTFRILGDGIVTLDVDLFCGNYKQSIHFSELRPGAEGQPLKCVIPSEDGTGEICILYTVFEDATTASLEIKLTSLESTSHYGIIGAGTEAIQRPQFTSLLYLSKFEQRTRMRPGTVDMFQLSKSIVVVPLDSQLVVHANLLTDGDVEMLKGSLEFVPKRERHTEEQQHLVSQKARMDVKVTWKCEALTDHEKNVRAANSRRFFLNWFETSGLRGYHIHSP